MNIALITKNLILDFNYVITINVLINIIAATNNMLNQSNDYIHLSKRVFQLISHQSTSDSIV